MVLKIDSERIAALGGAEAMNHAVADFIAAREAHKFTVGVAAPLPASPIIAQIVERHGGEWQEVEPETGEGMESDQTLAAKFAHLEDQFRRLVIENESLRDALVADGVTTHAKIAAAARANG